MQRVAMRPRESPSRHPYCLTASSGSAMSTGVRDIPKITRASHLPVCVGSHFMRPHPVGIEYFGREGRPGNTRVNGGRNRSPTS